MFDLCFLAYRVISVEHEGWPIRVGERLAEPKTLRCDAGVMEV
jgi:hypothetical protein